MNRTASFLFAALALALFGASHAEAQQGGKDLRIGAGMVVDFAGEVDNGGGPDPDLDATLGIRGHLDYDLGRYFSLGGFIRASWWEAEYRWPERSFLFDIGPRLTGHYDWRDFRFYIAAMPGLTISSIDDDYGGRGYRYDRYYPYYGYGIDNPSAGFTMSIAPGVEYWFSRDFAVYTEIFGWVGHYFSHDFEDGRYGDIDFKMNQVAFNFGIVFAP